MLDASGEMPFGERAVPTGADGSFGPASSCATSALLRPDQTVLDDVTFTVEPGRRSRSSVDGCRPSTLTTC